MVVYRAHKNKLFYLGMQSTLLCLNSTRMLLYLWSYSAQIVLKGTHGVQVEINF